MKFNVKTLAITCGVLWSLTLFVATWWIIAFDGSGGDAGLAGQIYRGYTITPLGSIVGLVWGLVDGFIGGAIFGWAYNFVSVRVSKKTV